MAKTMLIRRKTVSKQSINQSFFKSAPERREEHFKINNAFSLHDLRLYVRNPCHWGHKIHNSGRPFLLDYNYISIQTEYSKSCLIRHALGIGIDRVSDNKV